MTPKRIAMISFHTCPLASEEGKETGGMNVYVLELSKALAKNGCIVDVFTRSQDAHKKKIVHVTSNFRVIHVVAGPEKPVAKKQLLPYIDEFSHNVVDFIKKEDRAYELFHCHYYLSGLAGRAIQKLLGRSLPIVMSFHTLALMKNLVARGELEREEKERIDAEFSLCKTVQKIISPSESDKNYLEYLYNAPADRIVILPPGVDTTLFHPIDKTKAKQYIGAELNHKIVLFVGRIEPLKGIDVLLYAMKILRERNPRLTACLWIVGGDVTQHPRGWSKTLQSLEHIRSMLQMTTSVKFVGQKPQHELPYYYNAADVVVMPSHYESFGLSALEAMACGVPVITTNVTGVSSLLDDQRKAVVTSVHNPLLLASQMEHLLTDEVARREVGRRVLERVQDLDWNTVARKVFEVYADVTS